MGVKLVRRVAADLLGRGESSIRLKGASIEDINKAITRDDVRELIKSGKVYALNEKHNLSAYGKETRKKRLEGRKRGPGRKKGTKKTRAGVEYKKKIRAQRRIIKDLKEKGVIDNSMFKQFYRLVKGGTFQTKVSLINHIKGTGVSISEDEFKRLKHI
ncbi:MAG: 50S ribosomal protein L19e [Candidatus Micrarchaeales archaeon]|jgi:large subunit ribosomal protein L19e|uniref:Large ribosomal subunit protein eL19 n=1 Tax=Candidatus Micrarchaeum acidiphilum ARMAN-2 TaxID=425595 RepID=C7DIU5_MICA2|nr:MAG: Ribosomal protein L19e [Candidatus Micrarchaeum acidiphilum ARMAN-2]MCW6161307.1 50S ribosomal protein L19e [Candidatus Micrarchaeales archaeon]